MAERRMFAKTIIDSDAFLDMPLSSQCLYFHLSMRADDDGFINNPKKIQRMVGASEDDLKLLVLKNFVLVFETGVIVIKHWKIHNYIRNDRYKPTMYQEEKGRLSLKENGAYSKDVLPCIQKVEEMDTTGIPNGNQMETQDRLGKDRLELGKDSINTEVTSTSCAPKAHYEDVVNLYHSICLSFPRVAKITQKRKDAISARFRSGYTLDELKKVFQMAEDSTFLKGGNDRNWHADFDWLIKDSNMAKVLEGKYVNKAQAKKPDTKNKFNNFPQREYDADDMERRLLGI